MPDKARIRTSLLQLDRIFPGLENDFEGGATKCWDQDVRARGAYIDWRRGQLSLHFEHICSPEGRIHFAGEHTSKRFASMEGALESGRRVANEIHSRLSN